MIYSIFTGASRASLILGSAILTHREYFPSNASGRLESEISRHKEHIQKINKKVKELEEEIRETESIIDILESGDCSAEGCERTITYLGRDRET